jgi:hypothetical protein
MKRNLCSRVLICGLMAAAGWTFPMVGVSGRVFAQSPLFPNTRPLEQGAYDGGFGRMLIRPPPGPYFRPATPVYSGYGRGFGPANGNGSSPHVLRYGGAGTNQVSPGRIYAR